MEDPGDRRRSGGEVAEEEAELDEDPGEAPAASGTRGYNEAVRVDPSRPEGALGALVGEERLARALAIGVPAFVRRARALEELLERLRASIRAEWSRRVEVLLSAARALEASRLEGAPLPESALTLLEVLRAEPLFAKRRSPPARSPRAALRRLAPRLRAFNRGWALYLETVPMDEVRRAQADYNRYYPIEREMAVRLPNPAFQEVRLLERSDLAALFPPLPEPARGA